MAAALIVNGQPAVARSAHPAAAAAAGSVVVGSALLRPDADVPGFAVVPRGSVAGALADPVAQPKPVGAASYLKATGRSASTTVTMRTGRVAGARPSAGRIWFYAQTGAGTTLRVEGVWGGAARVTTVVSPRHGFAWRSLKFTAPNQKAVDDLQLRFTSSGSAAQIRAAYVDIATSGHSLRLRPDGDAGHFAVTPRGRAASALDEAVSQPARAAATDYVAASTAGESTTVDVGDTSMQGVQPGPSRAWFYAQTGKATTLRLEVLWDGVAHAAATVPATRGFGWYSVGFTPTSSAAVSGLQLRVVSVGGRNAVVRAAYVALVKTITDKQYLNTYLSGLAPIAAGPDQPEHAVGPTSGPTTSDPLPDPGAPSGQSRYECTSTPYSLSSAPEKIVSINPDSNKLWLGGLLQGQGYAGGLGSLRELPIRKRAPIRIYTDLLGPGVSITIPHPDAASVQQGIGDLVQRAANAHVPIPARASYDQTTQQSSSQALLRLGISAKYLGASAEAKLDVNRSVQESSIMASFMQRMFTVSVVTPATPADYFSPDFGKADLDAQVALGRVAPDNPPVVVASISFGRILLYSVTSKASSNELSAALNAAYSGGVASGSINVSAQQQDILNNARYQVVALGGEDSAVLSLIRTHQLGDYFTSHSDPATAVPISYQVNNIGNDSAAKFTETSNYNLTECTKRDNHQVPVGAVVQVSNPNAYLTGPRDPADVYGNLDLNGSASWSVSRDNPIPLHLHNVTPLQWVSTGPANTQPVQRYNLYFNPARGPSTFSLSGSMNCRLRWWEIGSDPSNQYRYTWNISEAQYGSVGIDGGSAHCGIQLQTQISKVNDLVDWEP